MTIWTGYQSFLCVLSLNREGLTVGNLRKQVKSAVALSYAPLILIQIVSRFESHSKLRPQLHRRPWLERKRERLANSPSHSYMYILTSSLLIITAASTLGKRQVYDGSCWKTRRKLYFLASVTSPPLKSFSWDLYQRTATSLLNLHGLKSTYLALLLSRNRNAKQMVIKCGVALLCVSTPLRDVL